jgi:hypothetical protein
MIWQTLGPITLLIAYAILALLPLTFPYDLFLTGAVGLYFCGRWQLKGCSYALILLALFGLVGHIFFENHHFLRLGLEACFGCSFFIAALAFEMEAEEGAGWESLLASRLLAIRNLEEEIAKSRESQIEAQIGTTKKVEELQKNYEELASEKSSLEILNDVLRKANAAQSNEKWLDDKIRLDALLHEKHFLELELDRFKKGDLAEENRALQKDLNDARFHREQNRLISETLARLHADATIRAKDLEMELQQAKEAASASVVISPDFEELQEHLAATERKMSQLLQMEHLYKQLKVQFEEKSQILHQTRSALFKAETELQTLALEKSENGPFLPEPLSKELSQLDEEIESLRGENLQLQELVTHLTERLPQPGLFASQRTPLPAGAPSLEETLRESLLPKKKRKSKKAKEQDLLF